MDAPLIIDETGVFLVGSLELFQEAYVIFGEKTKVFHLIFEVGDALDAHTKCIAFVFGGVNAISFEHVGVYHAASKDFEPAGAFAHVAAFSFAKRARYVHFCTWFCEWEIGRTETNLCVFAKHFFSKEEKHLLEVCKTHFLIYIKSFDLMEEAMCTSRDGFVAINATRADDTYWWLLLFHHACLYRTGVSAQNDVWMRFYKESVLHIACWMVVGKVHR